MKKKNLLTRVIIIAIVTISGFYLVIGPRHRPTSQDFSWSGIKTNLASNIHLGLDLQGGSHLVMRVKTEEFLRRLTEENYVAAQNAAKDAGFEIKGGRANEPRQLSRGSSIGDPSKANEVKDAVEKKVELGDTQLWNYSASGDTLIWTMTQAAERLLADNATTQALNIIDSRINALGIAEPTLQTHGAQSSHQILLQMPGVQDPERVKNILARESRLELVHVIVRRVHRRLQLMQPKPKRSLRLTVVERFHRIARFCLTRSESRKPQVTIRTSKNQSAGSWSSFLQLSTAAS